MVRAILFDVDGTLIDSNPLHVEAWVRAFADFGVTVAPQAVHSQLGKGGDQLMPVFLSPEQVEDVGEALEAYRSKLYAEEYLPRARPFPGVRALFERVRAEGVCAILASSGKTAELERYQQVAGIAELVDAVVTSDDVAHSKPAADVFRAALDRVRPIPPEDAMAIGDTPYDAQSAAGAGVKTIGLLSGGFPRSDLLGAGCVAVYDDVADLLANYEASPLGSAARVV